MKPSNSLVLLATASIISIAAGAATAATITGWNTDNVVVGATPADGVTGYSVVYDGDPADPTAVSNGRIAFTPPEAVSPGIKVQPETYTQGGPGGITLDGCIMTSNPGATCTSPFQSGKRVKQQVTGFGPVDLVFDVAPGSTTSIYQVFDRIINVTSKSLAGFAIELGFGVGNDFVEATATDGISFSSGFRAQPSGSGPVSTQYPFGLFGDATDNPNFSLDGFFAADRTGLTVDFTGTKLTSTGFYGPYETLFSYWLAQQAVPDGAFWDNDNDPSTDALLMAWFNPETNLWEMRRDVVDLAGGVAGSLTGTDVMTFATFELLNAELGLGSLLSVAPIEDLANLNINFALEVGDLGNHQSFTLRTTVLPAPVPVPVGGPMLVAALGGLALLRRRNAKA